MKIIAITQRVEQYPDRNESRDELDQAWSDFLDQIEAVALPVPNRARNLPKLLDRVGISGIILSGGGDLRYLNAENASLDREAREEELIAYAMKHRLPILGVCRGAQKLCEYFGVKCSPVEGHVATRHEILIEDQSLLHTVYGKQPEVNSFHKYAPLIASVKPPLKVVALAANGIIEAVQHAEYRFFGLQWHPERDRKAPDIQFLKGVFL